MSDDDWDAVKRWCLHGHEWIDQGDGTVSPSWGLGGMRMPVGNPLLCPEPLRDATGVIMCPSCGSAHFTGASWDYPQRRGASCTHLYPPPGCLQPALGGNRWKDRDLPFDDTDWCAWWVRNAGPWHLTFHQSYAGGARWAAIYRCWDVATGESMLVDRDWQVRRASLAEYPAYVRERWWHDARGQLAGNWRTPGPGGAGWLISSTQAVALIKQAAELGVAGPEGQLMLDL